jgi:hypothetical protein
MSRPTKRKSRITNPIAKLLPTFIHKRFKDLTKYTRKLKHGKKLWLYTHEKDAG